MGGFHLFADVAKYGRTYNRPVERSGDGKPSVGSNSQSVSINENVFQSFNSYAKERRSWGNNARTCRANTVQVMLDQDIGVSDCNKFKDLSVISELLKHMSSEGFDELVYRYVGGRWRCFSTILIPMKDVLDRPGGLPFGNGLQALWNVDISDSDSPKNVNNESLSPSILFCRERISWCESDLVDSFEKEGEIRDDSSCIMKG
ncbi:hypothetical protein Tco_0934232 [Tanacetum coccineum]